MFFAEEISISIPMHWKWKQWGAELALHQLYGSQDKNGKISKILFNFFLQLKETGKVQDIQNFLCYCGFFLVLFGSGVFGFFSTV